MRIRPASGPDIGESSGQVGLGDWDHYWRTGGLGSLLEDWGTGLITGGLGDWTHYWKTGGLDSLLED